MISTTSKIDQEIGYLTSAVYSIHSEIQHLFTFNDVMATLLFRLDGRVLTSQYETESSSTILSIIKSIKDIIYKTKEELSRGARSIKYDKRTGKNNTIPVYFYRVGNSSILVTILSTRANTGLMEIEMSRTARRLGMIIDRKKAIGDFSWLKLLLVYLLIKI